MHPNNNQDHDMKHANYEVSFDSQKPALSKNM